MPFPWRLTPFKTNISDVEYQVTEKGRAASVITLMIKLVRRLVELGLKVKK